MAYEAVYWMVVVAGIVSFVSSFGIGANNISNSFATSVGARSVTLLQAIILGSIFQFVGAMFLGGEVARTIAGGITSPTTFEQTPDAFAFGQLCTLCASAFWLITATALELPVSTTHTTIGAIIGFAFVYGGPEAVNWATPVPDFPFYSGLVPVVISWFLSPLLSGAFTAMIFLPVRRLVLRAENASHRAVYLLPLLVIITVWTNVFFVIVRGARSRLGWSIEQASWVSAVAAGGCGLLAAVFGMPLIRRKVKAMAADSEEPLEVKDMDLAEQEAPNVPPKGAMANFFWNIKQNMTKDIHKEAERTSAHVNELQDNVERFDPGCEYVFTYLQVLSACAVAFANGANAVANAAGPFSAITSIYETFRVSSRVEVDLWVKAVCATGMVVGLATYGWKIMMVLGVKTAAMTPSRGFGVELSTALVMSLGSFAGLPLSSTQCQVGATIGIGLCEGRNGVSGPTLVKFCIGWVMTLVVAALVSGGLFAFGVYSPNLSCERGMDQQQSDGFAVIIGQLSALNSSISNSSDPELFNLLNAPIGPDDVDQMSGQVSASAGVLVQALAYSTPNRSGTLSQPIYVIANNDYRQVYLNASGIYNFNSMGSLAVNDTGVPPTLGYGAEGLTNTEVLTDVYVGTFPQQEPEFGLEYIYDVACTTENEYPWC